MISAGVLTVPHHPLFNDEIIYTGRPLHMMPRESLKYILELTQLILIKLRVQNQSMSGISGHNCFESYIPRNSSFEHLGLEC